MNPFATLAKADRQLRTIRKANPSQSLGGIVISNNHQTVAPIGKVPVDDLILQGFKRNIWAYTCTDRLSSFAAQAYWRVEERVGDEWKPRANDWRNRLLAYPMADKMSGYEVFYYWGAWIAIDGNGLLRKTPGGENGILELVPMTPKNMEAVLDDEEWVSGYNLIEDGKVIWNALAEEMIHARLPDPSNPCWGFGMMRAAWQPILSDNASGDWRTKSMQAGGVPPVAIIDEELTPGDGPGGATQQAAALRVAFRRNAIDRTPMLMGGKKQIAQFGFTPSDMEIPEDRALTMAEIVNAHGMHPSIFSNDSATYDNMDAGIRYSYENGVMKILTVQREALNLGLLTREERESDSVYINFDLSQIPFFRRQRESKIAAMGTAIRSGVSRNDYVIMADLGLDPADGGDAVFIESGLTLLSEAAEGVESGAEQDPPFPPSNQPNPFAPKEEPEPEGDEDAPKAMHLSADKFRSLVEKYDPNQPRDPGGEGGGQWVSGGSSSGDVAISDSERKSLEEWTLSNKWEKLNEALRDGTALSADQQEMAKNIDSAISKAPEFDSPVTVFRGINFGQQAMPSGAALAGMSAADRVASVRDAMADFAEKRFPVGATVELGGYQSTSKVTGPALDASLSRTSPGIVFQINAKKGIDLSKISRLDDEGEILLPRNSRFRISRVERNATFETNDGRSVTRTVVHADQI